MMNGSIKCFKRLTTQRSSTCICDGSADHDGQFCFVLVAKIFFDGEDGGLCIECIENGFNEKKVNSSIYQSLHLFVISSNSFIETECTVTGIIYIRRKRKCFVQWTNSACYEFLFT